MSKTITPMLWFDGQAEEAMAFYCSIFPDAEKLGIQRMGPGHEAPVLTASFRLMGLEFTALNGGPQFHFTEAVSFVIPCETQEEVDHYWSKLTGDGGQESMCGWLKDRFGLSWQVIPDRLLQLLGDPDPERANRAMQAMLQMRKIDIPTLEAAANGDLVTAG